MRAPASSLAQSLLLALLLSLAAGCLPYERKHTGGAGTVDSEESDADADADADSDSDSDADSDTGTGSPITLTSDHPGWQNPACTVCHSYDAHNDGLEPYQCAACHGSNGAPAGHGQSSGCDGCHDAPHGDSGFPVPDSCLVCHPS